MTTTTTMVAETTQQKQKKKNKTKKKVLQQQRPSKAFFDALEAIPAVDFEKLQPKVDRVFEIGRKEGLTDKAIGGFVRGRMKGEYSRMSIWRVLKKYSDALQKHEKSVTKGYTSKHNTEQQVTTESIRPETEEESETDEEEQLEREHGQFQIRPEDYIIQDLPKYTSELKSRIIIYLDEQLKEAEEKNGDLCAAMMKFDAQQRIADRKIAELEGGSKKK